MNLKQIKAIVARISCSVLDVDFQIRVERDVTHGKRIFLQIVYSAPCTKTGTHQEWHGRKWYLSEYMTADEIVKTAYAAFEAAVKHEVMEGFKVDDKTLFNPHVDFEELLKISHKEIKRPELTAPTMGMSY